MVEHLVIDMATTWQYISRQGISLSYGTLQSQIELAPKWLSSIRNLSHNTCPKLLFWCEKVKILSMVALRLCVTLNTSPICSWILQYKAIALRSRPPSTLRLAATHPNSNKHVKSSMKNCFRSKHKKKTRKETQEPEQNLSSHIVSPSLITMALLA